MKAPVHLLKAFYALVFLSSLAKAGQDAVDLQSPEPVASAPASATLKKSQTDTNSTTTRIERVVMPFTQWVEEKIQDSSIVNPTSAQQAEKKQSSGSNHLRTAIEKARAKHPGTVLSADRVDKNGQTSYLIKILSAEGIVKVVNIDDQGQ